MVGVVGDRALNDDDLLDVVTRLRGTHRGIVAGKLPRAREVVGASVSSFAFT